MPTPLGLQPLIAYTALATFPLRIAALRDAIPNPNVTADARQSLVGAYFDQMSPICAAQLRNELNLLAAAIQSRPAISYTITAGDVTATFADIPTGLAAVSIANSIIEIRRAGAVVGSSNVPTTVVAGSVRIATGGSYTLTAGDVVRLIPVGP